MSDTPQITLSVVSHGQGAIVRDLLADCRTITGATFEIILTLNIPEDQGWIEAFSDLPIRIIENAVPKGFGANHNAAFRQSTGGCFAIVNPDIRATPLDLARLVSMVSDPRTGACAPLVLGPGGDIEDSARIFPTLPRLLSRTLLGRRGADYDLSGNSPVAVDWVAGMFVVFDRQAFASIGGFDDRRYFMYLEDADICQRLRRAGYEVLVDPTTRVVHHAQRASRRSVRHLRWHAVSSLRFLTGL